MPPMLNRRFKFPLLAAGLAGFTGVLAGTFGAHGLQGVLPVQRLEVYEVGVRYHLIHALGLLGISVLVELRPDDRWPRWAGWAWLIGIVLFSGSLYALSLMEVRWLGWITPPGGLAFMIGWGLICVSAFARPCFRGSPG